MDDDLVGFDLVDQTVAPNEDLAHLHFQICEFMDWPPSMRQLSQRASCISSLAGELDRCPWIVVGDVVGDLFEIVPSGFGPDY